MNTLYFVLFLVLTVSCIGGLVSQQVFLSRLRRLHHSTWEHLGRPVIFLNSGMLNTAGFLRFMWRREYESLPDAGTVAFARFLRAFLIFYFVLFGLTILVFFSTMRSVK
ncbi:MAG: hypothetical protein QOH88_1407 [Verrucomicrobiota bacterium]|jgi:hypothetical protein